MARTAPLLTEAQVAELLGTSTRQVKNLCDHRRLPFVKVGHLVRFRPTDIDAWIDANTVAARP